MKTVKLSSKNQIVVPSSARKQLGIASGDNLVIKRVTKTEIVLEKEPTYYDVIGTVSALQNDAVNRVRSNRDEWK